ncbi:DUF4381 domain-containing protein [Aestuariirhabdus litorea]|uniref:DUF4381 domain-containing protein n=1 Tax=Aestuariirhabdus litorea TaxID=2528527 RepID=UPI0013E3FD2C|nr:DUF4381 domain-containing protein [Aestuariirhabdus litorea]
MDKSQLLEQLAPLAEPPTVSLLWPLAPGWYLLGLLGLVVLTAVYWLYRRRRSVKARNAYRLIALKELETCWLEFEEKGVISDFVEQANQLLKRVALTAYPDAGVAPLHGEDWWHFLEAHYPGGESREARQIETGRYRGPLTDNPAPLYQYTKSWIERHEP